MDLKKIKDNLGMWIGLATVFVAVAGTITVYASMPKKVEAIEAKVEENKIKAYQKIDEANIEIDNTKDNLNKLAGSIDKYVTLQAEQQKSQEMREALMLKLIEQKKDR